jgi:hypothetical protein
MGGDLIGCHLSISGTKRSRRLGRLAVGPSATRSFSCHALSPILTSQVASEFGGLAVWHSCFARVLRLMWSLVIVQLIAHSTGSESTEKG